MRRIAVAERVPEAALERLQAELGDVGVVLALGRFDQLRTDKSAKIDRVSHDSVSEFGSFRRRIRAGNALPRP